MWDKWKPIKDTYPNIKDVWVDSIKYSNSLTNSFWIEPHWINAGVLISKPIEYEAHLPKWTWWDGLRKFALYRKVTSILETLWPIRDYKIAKGIPFYDLD